MAVEQSGPILVKRYGGDRLYEPGRLRYVSIEQLRALVATGEAVSIVDSGSGQDLTAKLLR